MQGTKSDPGVIPRVVRVSGTSTLSSYPPKRLQQGIFEKRQYLQKYQITLEVSYMEIYKDEVYDLLVTRENVRASHSPVNCISQKQKKKKKQAPKLPVRENDSGMVFVANLSRIPISSVDEFDHIYT